MTCESKLSQKLRSTGSPHARAQLGVVCQDGKHFSDCIGVVRLYQRYTVPKNVRLSSPTLFYLGPRGAKRAVLLDGR